MYKNGDNNLLYPPTCWIKDRPGKMPAREESSSPVAEIAALFRGSGFIYDNHGGGGNLEGMLYNRLKHGNTPEQMKRAIDAMKTEVARSGKKKNDAGYFLTVLDSIEMNDEQKEG